MAECILDFNKLGVEHRDHFVFYASSKVIVYKEGRNIVATDCDGDIITRLTCPVDYKKYSYVETEDDIVFLFAGKKIVYIDLVTDESFVADLPIQKIGRSVSEIYPSEHNQGIVLVSRLHGQTHVVNYNFIEGTRICQSSSWQVAQVNDTVYSNGYVYLLMDNAFIACCNASTGETVWTRFETGRIEPNIVPLDGNMVYACQGILKISGNKSSKSIKIPTVRPNSVKWAQGDSICFTANNNKNLCGYNVKKEELEWEITGTEPILETVVTRATRKGRTYDALVVRTKSHISTINLTLGQSHTYFPSTGSSGLKKTGDHVLIHRQADRTDMIPGVQDDN